MPGVAEDVNEVWKDCNSATFSPPPPIIVVPTPTDSVLDIETLTVFAVRANPAFGVKSTFIVPEDMSTEYVPSPKTDEPKSVERSPYSKSSAVVPS